MVQEMKFYLQRSIIYDIRRGQNRYPLEYPMFIAFTSEGKESMQRNYLEATINGLSPDARKVCATSRCEEGFTVREIMDDLGSIPEVTEEEYVMFLEIPHWNPVDKLDLILMDYSNAVKRARAESEGSEVELILHDLIKDRILDIDEDMNEAIRNLPEGDYSREKEA